MASPRIQIPKLNAIGIVLCVSLLSLLLLPFVGDLAVKTPNSTSSLFIPGNSSANCVGDLTEKTPNSPSPLFYSANCDKEGSCIGLTRSLLPESFGKAEIYVHNVSAEGLSSEGNKTASPLSDTSMNNAPIHNCEECQVSAGPGSPTLQLRPSTAPLSFTIACAICGWTTMNYCGECMRFLLDESNGEFNPNQSYVSSQGNVQVPAQCLSTAMCRRCFKRFHKHCLENWLACFFTCPACDEFMGE